MTLKDLLSNPMFTRITLILWLVSSAFIIILLGKIDSIVHGDLYNYGLQFNLVWASPYWFFERLIYVLLSIPMILSFVALASGLLNRGNGKVRTNMRETKKENNKAQAAKDSSVLMSCPNCKKLFGKPLTMLNFSGGKTRLVNVCPYCNHILGNAEEESPDNIRIADLTKQKVEQK